MFLLSGLTNDILNDLSLTQLLHRFCLLMVVFIYLTPFIPRSSPFLGQDEDYPAEAGETGREGGYSPPL
jgi:hypothetical protein